MNSKKRVPTELQVIALMDKTNESHRKCYFWLLEELNKPKKKRTPLIRSISTSSSNSTKRAAVETI